MQFNVVFRLNSKKLPVKFSESTKPFKVAFKGIQTVTVRQEAEYYNGAYEVTPNAAKQVLSTNGKTLSADIVVHPIPKEYGLVTYDQDRTITIT